MLQAYCRSVLSLLSRTAALIIIVMMLFVTGCSKKPQEHSLGEGVKYFDNPPQAVIAIKGMLKASAWEELSRYYDLSGTDIDRARLMSGEFFVREKRPEVSHPGGFWRFKQPFSPQFSYLSHSKVSDEIVEVTVQVEIDQGGGMIQRGMDSFQLRKSAEGYQLLPKQPHD